MKVLVIASAFGLIGSAALADCMGHMPVSASVDVDRTIMTASIQKTDVAKDGEAVLLKKSERLPEETGVNQ